MFVDATPSLEFYTLKLNRELIPVLYYSYLAVHPETKVAGYAGVTGQLSTMQPPKDVEHTRRCCYSTTKTCSTRVRRLSPRPKP